MSVTATRLAAASVVLAFAVALAPGHAELPPALTVEGTTFVLRLADGRVLRSPELVGAELDLGDGSVLRVDAVRPDPQDPAGEVLLHELSILAPDGTWREVCDEDREGRSEAFPMAGRWGSDGRFHGDASHFALTCTSGAQGKCVRMGYRPWAAAADGTSLAPLYEACVRMVRADYCGDGIATTRDGTLIDVYDRLGVQRPESGPELTFEAGWSPEGAVCVAHTRIPENLTLEQLGERCPRLASAVGAACDEAAAAAGGAVLFNRSR